MATLKVAFEAGTRAEGDWTMIADDGLPDITITNIIIDMNLTMSRDMSCTTGQ